MQAPGLVQGFSPISGGRLFSPALGTVDLGELWALLLPRTGALA